MTPEQFISTWKNNPLIERAVAQAHFDALLPFIPPPSGEGARRAGEGAASPASQQPFPHPSPLPGGEGAMRIAAAAKAMPIGSGAGLPHRRHV